MLTIIILLASVAGQVYPPMDLRIEFDSDRYAEHFHVPTPNPQTDVPVFVTYKSNGGTWWVQLEFFPKTGASYRGSKKVVVPTAFRPTAVCRRAGSSDKLYVAGWDSASGSAILEEWRIGTFTVFGGAMRGGGVTTTSMSTPQIHRTNVMDPTAPVGPIRSIACNPLADQVWILEAASPRVLHVLDTTNQLVTTTTTEAALPDLVDKMQLDAGMSSVGGFVIHFRPSMRWDKPPEPDDEIYFVVADLNLDGIADVFLSMTRAQLLQAAPSATWDPEY